MNRLETVAHIRQRTAHNHTHRVIDVRGLHFLVNLHRNDVIILNQIVVFFHFVLLFIIDFLFGPPDTTCCGGESGGNGRTYHLAERYGSLRPICRTRPHTLRCKVTAFFRHVQIFFYFF